jgi:hypothetical protein
MLSMARALNDDEYAAFQKAFEACLLASGGRPEFRRIEEAKPGFEAANKRRIEREMLGGAAVVIDWLDALAEAGLGKGAIFRQSGSKLAYLWDSGAPGKGCSCGLVSGAPCRDYNPVRVEARWSAGAEEIGICKVPLPPSHRAVLYRSVATRGKMISNPAQIERFINGTGQDSIEALFGPARVAVEAYGNECSAKIANSRSAAAVAEEGAAGERAGRGDKAKLKAGSCVRWGCDMTECRYQGRIKAKRGQGFVVTITRAPKTTEFNKNVTMDGKDLEACEQ